MTEVLYSSQTLIEVGYEVPSNILLTQTLVEIGYIIPTEQQIQADVGVIILQTMTPTIYVVPLPTVSAQVGVILISTPSASIGGPQTVSAQVGVILVSGPQASPQVIIGMAVSNAVIEVGYIPSVQLMVSEALLEVGFVKHYRKYGPPVQHA